MVEELTFWFAVVSAIVLGVVAFEQHLTLRELEIDLKVSLQNYRGAAKHSSETLRVHYDAVVFSLSTLISKYFKLPEFK